MADPGKAKGAFPPHRVFPMFYKLCLNNFEANFCTFCTFVLPMPLPSKT